MQMFDEMPENSIRYNKGKDTLYIDLNQSSRNPSEYDEIQNHLLGNGDIQSGIILRRPVYGKQITGITIMDYSKQHQKTLDTVIHKYTLLGQYTDLLNEILKDLIYEGYGGDITQEFNERKSRLYSVMRTMIEESRVMEEVFGDLKKG